MNGLDTSVTLHRTGSGDALVLLHCLGVDHRFWDFTTPLAERFLLLRYDFPGHGQSAVPSSEYGIETLSAQLVAICDQHDVARAHVAGISLGGLVAQHFAATNPDRVDRLVLIDTTPKYTDQLNRMWVERASIARSIGVAALVEDLLKIWFSADLLSQDPPAVRYVRSTMKRTPGEGYALACEALAAADLRHIAKQIEAPTLVICGDDDIPSFLESARWLAANIRNAELAWIAGARHASVLEKPESALPLLRRFLPARSLGGNDTT